MSVQTCAGCGASIGRVICCDPCWDRVPTNLPEWPRWRSRLRACRQTNDWASIEDIINAVRKWLTANQRPLNGAKS